MGFNSGFKGLKHVKIGALYGPVPFSSNLNLASVLHYTKFAIYRVTK